jgi:hypothetical protein
MPEIIEGSQFRVIAREGLGRIANSTAHAMAFFGGALYVGTSSSNVSGADDTPGIYRYEIEADKWTTVYEPPLVERTARADVPDLNLAKHFQGIDMEVFSARRRADSSSVPRDAGYRSMCIFQGRSDSRPALYASTMSRTGGRILRTFDGEKFEQVGDSGLFNKDIYSFRGLTGLNGQLFVSPAGTVTDKHLDRNLAPESRVYVTDDPAGGKWVPASEPGFGDPDNESVYCLYTAHNYLYAGTANPERGFQLWRTSAKGEPPFRWDPVIFDGGGAFNHNMAISAMAEFKGDLYIGSGITGLGYDTVHDVGPASAELIRVRPDGTWDLIAGRMRFTPDGLKVPLSMLGPGLGDFYNSVVWALCVHDDAIYLGTHQWEAVRSLQVNPQNIVGGYQLWGSTDGEIWLPVLEDGNGNPAQLGIRTLESTPHGLFVGTSNHSRLIHMLGRRKIPDINYEAGLQVLWGR